jgi:hypothetical protein
MKKRDAALIALAFAVAGCAGADKIKKWPEEKLHYSVYASDDKKTARREEILRRHPEWTEDVKQSVKSGAVAVGMTEDQALAAYGKPLEILASSADQEKNVEGQKEHALWIYPHEYLTFDGGVLGRVEDVVKVEVEESFIEKVASIFQS